MVERFNRTLLAMLDKLCDEHPDDWDDHLPYAVCAYRATIHDSTGCSPNLLMLGREVSLPVDLMYVSPEDHDEYACPVEYVEWVRQASQGSFTRARHCLQRAAARQKKYYDRRAHDRKLNIGDWVLRLYPPATRHDKLNYQYHGPFWL